MALLYSTVWHFVFRVHMRVCVCACVFARTKTDMTERVCSADKVVLPMNSMPSSSTAPVTGGQRGQKKRKQREEGRGGGRGKRAGGEEEEEVEREGNKLEHIQSSTLAAFAPAT